MAYENNPGQGVMFPNDQQGNPNRPAWRGSINIGGKEWELSAWEKTSARGNRYLSLDAREPYQQGQQQTQPQQSRQSYAPQNTQSGQYAPQGQPQRQSAPRQYAAAQPAQAQAPQVPTQDLPF